MEFLKVTVQGREGQDIDVLINGEKNGKAGEILTLGEGFVIISVDLLGAEEKEINLIDTSPDKPMSVKVKV